MKQGLSPFKRAAAQTIVALALGLTPGNLILIAWAQPPKAKWQAEWEETLAAAKREGQVNVYVTLGPHEVVPVFQEVYPDIRPVIVAGRSGQIA